VELVFVFEVVAKAGLGLFYEKEVTSVDALTRALHVLDEDSGIRLIGERDGQKCLVFVTKFGQKYTVMTYGMKGRTGGPGERLDAAEVEGAEAVARFIRKATSRRVRAYVY
jgi:hypothetical protein